MAADSPDDLHALDVLPVGTRFGELEIVRTLGVGGFGIVYLAQDHALQRQVAIKEYMPGQLAQRGGGSQVSVRAGSYQETFDIGRRSFVNEARLLARFDHRALLKVYQFWEANGTAYMAMPYLQGLTLRQTRQAMTGTPDEAWMLALLLPLLDGLTLLHAEGVLHRDIAPDNILLPAVGKDGGADPILLDFGAARHAIGDRTQTITAILKPSYAPIEQYAEATALRQGPWTDVYALGAVMHYMVTGRPPPPATARAVADDYAPLAGQHLPGLSPRFLAAIDAALGVRPQDRPQSAAALRAALLGQSVPSTAVAARADATTVIDLGLRAAAPAAAALDLELDDAPAPPPPSPAVVDEMRAERVVVAAPPALKTGGGAGRWLAMGVLLAGAGLAGWWLLLRTPPAVPALPLAVVAPVRLPAAAPSVAAVDAAEQPMAASAPVSSPASAAALPAVVASAASSAASAASSATITKPAATRIVRPPPLLREPVVKSTPSATSSTAAPAFKPPPPMPRQDSSMTLPTPAAPAATAQLERAPPTAQPSTSSSPAAGVPAGPREACGNRIFIAMSMCIARECKTPAYADHPECVRLREIDEQRGRRIGQ